MKTFSVDEAADFLNISADSLKYLAGRGIVPGAKIGKAWVFLDESLEYYLRDEVVRQTTERRKLSGFTEGDSYHAPKPPVGAAPKPAPDYAPSTVLTAFSRDVRRRPMEPPPLPQLPEPPKTEPSKPGRPARKPPPLSR